MLWRALTLGSFLLLVLCGSSRAQLQAPWPMRHHDSAFTNAAPPAVLPAKDYCEHRLSAKWKPPTTLGELILPAPGLVMMLSTSASGGADIQLFNRSSGRASSMTLEVAPIGIDSTGAMRLYYTQPTNDTTLEVGAMFVLSDTAIWSLSIDSDTLAFYNSYADAIDILFPPSTLQISRYDGKSGTFLWSNNIAPLGPNFGNYTWAGSTNSRDLLLCANSLLTSPTAMVWLSAIDGKQGKQKWSTTLPGTWPAPGSALLVSLINCIAVWTESSSADYDVLYGLSPQTGHMIWNVTVPSKALAGVHMAAIPQLGLIAVESNSVAYIFNATSGALVKQLTFTTAVSEMRSIGTDLFIATSSAMHRLSFEANATGALETVMDGYAYSVIVDSDGSLVHWMEGKDGLWILSPCSKHKKHHPSAAVGIVLITAGCLLLAFLLATGGYWYYRKHYRARADYQPVY